MSERQVPIDVLGVAFRLPGGIDRLDDLGRALAEGRDTVQPVDARWDPSRWCGPGQSVTRRAHLLDDPHGFDAGLFGISPRESRAMDPRQRLLLEAAWRALEDAGIPPDGLDGRKVGVYVGMGLDEWSRRTMGTGPIDAFAATGALSSVAAGRIAYALGLRGPALAVHTACSSSLVAIHLAMRALHDGEIELAIAGGVNLLLDPEPFVAFSQLGALSPDGRCRTFDADAAGYGRGEAVALLVLGRSGAPALARLLGSAINQDGRTNGLTAPSGAAQEQVIRAALASAGLAPGAVGALEAHGTGTPLGDPIEIAAAAAALGEGGSVQVHATKARFGHSEAAAGAVGVLAAIAATRAGVVPALHVARPNPRIAWGGRLAPSTGAPLAGVTGVSAFGFSGTNAHVIVGPASGEPEPARGGRVWIPVSAATPSALVRRVDEVAAALEAGDPPGEVARAAGRRAQLRERVAVVGEGPALAPALRAARATTARRPAPIAFLFAGQGAQHARMLDGVDDEPDVAGPFEEVDRLVKARTGRSVRDVVADPEALAGTEGAQIALFALEWAIAQALIRWGVVPDAVLGHSAGALAAAAVAGACDLADAVDLVIARGRLMASTAPGAMAAVADGAATGCEIAAINAPDEVVITGPEDRIAAAGGRRLAARHAFHSAAMDPILDRFAAAAATVRWRAPAIRFVSDATGREETVLDAAYWRAHLRGTVRWADALRASEGSAFVEIGPGATLCALGPRVLPGAWFAPTGRREGLAVRDALAASWVAGHRYTAAASDGWGRTRVALPPYPFERPVAGVVARAVAWFEAPVAPVAGAIDARGVRTEAELRAFAAQLSAARGAVVWTAGAVSVAGEPIVPAQAAVWAFAGCVAVERPEVVAALVDGDRAELAAGEPRTAIRGQTGFAPRLVERAPEALPAPSAEAVHVVTGAGGTVGGALLGWLASRGARRVVALGRSRPPPQVSGLTVDFRVVDLADPAAVRAAVADVPPGGWLIHAAGTGARVPADDLSDADWDEAFAAKARALDALLADLRPAAVLAPGSVAAVWGATGLAAYAAANAWVGARLAGLGVPWSCPAFGPWAGGLTSEAERGAYAAAGLRPLASAEAVAAIGAGAPVIAAVDPAAFGSAAHRRRPGERGWFDPPPAATVEAVVRREVARALGASGEIPSDRGFFELGLDSVGAVALAKALGGALGREVPPTAALDHPTIDALAGWLSGRAAAVVPAATAAGEPIAVAGMACRFPGADSPDGLWALLTGGPDPLGPSPPDRWSGAAEEGGFLQDLAGFDPRPFGMTPREAAAVDPQQRLVLELGWEALERAGLAPGALRDQPVGVFVGVGRPEYAARLRPGDDAWAWSGTGNETSFAAGRVAWALGLRGPALAVSTACSSSLVALHLAVASLRAGECSLAIVAGTNALLDPGGFRWLRDVGALSPGGRCRSFSADADGYARSEGCGVLVLATRARVEADGLPALAWVRGTAVGHDGRTAGPTVPSGPAQEVVIRAALAAAGAAPGDVGYVEAHGTGTPLGDPVEIGALSSVFGEASVVVGAAKSHLGHLEAAAGVAGVIAAVLALRHGRVPAIRHLAAANPRLPLGTWGRLADDTPLEPQQLAGVSAFGFSGTNAHVVLARGEGVPREPVTRPARVRCWIEADEVPSRWVVRPEPGEGWAPADVAALLAGWSRQPRPVRVAATPGAVAGAAASLAHEAPEAGIHLAQRLERAPDDGWTPEIPPGHAVVITGAAGAVGREVAAWVRARGGRVVGIGRSGEVEVAGDVADPATWDRIPDVPIAGVIHAAGVRADALAPRVDAALLERAARPKVAGLRAAVAWLDRRAPDAWIVAFGSALSVLGAAGQVAYGAANAALAAEVDALAATGRRAACLAWGPWTVGLASGTDWAARGAVPMSPSLALRALDRVRSGTTLVLDPRWTPRPAAPAPPRVAPHDVAGTVRRLAREVSRLTDLPDDRGWFDAGFDSLMAVELARRLSAELGRPVGPTALFEHPTLGSLVDHLAGERSIAASPAIRTAEPIAIVGLACRFPGADSPEALWRLLRAGDVPLREVPPDRWDAAAWDARIASRQGGFVDGIDQFDPELFGISAREAASLDPQQRLLLETAWRAREHLGDRLPERTGVWIGLTDRGYLRRFEPGETLYPDAWAGTGNEPAFGPGRLAFHLGLRGPAAAVNTTCSSSLVAVHLAVEALRAGACEAALAGGVSLLLNPDDSAYLTTLGALSPTGRCWSFDARADGYVRSEGCGLVVLERLSDARARGHRVWAVIRGSAVNHDGASGGLTVPNGAAQQAVLRAALADAGVAPESVGLVEAHGTGTRLGDPIEVAALRAVYPAIRLGTIKANLGHLELAAGVAGLLRATLALAHGEIPPHPTLREPNPEIARDGIEIPTARVPWTGPERRAGVSAFGLSGTNAHLVLEAADGPPPPAADTGPAVWPLSGHRREAVLALHAALVGRPAGEVAAALARRPALRWRRAVRSDEPLGEPREAPGSPPRIGWLLTGQGTAWAGMAAGLDALPAARDALDRADRVLRPEIGRPLREVFADSALLADTAYAQPAGVALAYALGAQWEAVAGPPAAALGHSVGGLAAALLAGILPFDDGLRLVALRGRLMSALPPGSMAALSAPADAVRAALVPGAEIAAINADDETVVSGAPDAVDEVVRRVGARATALPVSRAFHSAMLDPMLDAWEAAVGSVALGAPRFPVIPETEGGELQTAAGWRRHAREPVAFAAAARAFAARVDLAVELGPHPVLAGLVARAGGPEVLPTLRRGTGGPMPILAAIGAAWERGAPVVWDTLAPRAEVGPPVHLPLQPRRFWLPGDRATRDARVYTLGFTPIPEPPAADGVQVWRAPDAPAEAGCLALHEAIVRAGRDGRRLAVVTRRGAPLGTPDPEQAAVWAFARCAQVEAPDRIAAVVDVDDDAPPERWFGAGDVVVRGGVGHAPALARAPLVPADPDVRGAWLVTGGHGALGTAVADWLLARGAASVRRVSRRDGVDVSAPGALAALLDGVDGVAHLAGVTDPAPLDALDAGRIRAVLAAKVEGARALVDFPGQVILISSIAATLGSKDLAPYAASNGYLEAVAHVRRSAGRPALALALGPVAGGGMVDADRRAALERLGQRALPVPDVLRILGGALASGESHPIAADIAWDRFLKTYELFGPRSITAAFRAAPVAPLPMAPGAGPVDLAAIARRVLGRADDVPADVPLSELGLDSLLATELHGALRAAGADVPLVRLLGGPTLDEIGAMLRGSAPAPIAEEADVPPVLVWSHLAAALVGAGGALALWLLATRLLGAP